MRKHLLETITIVGVALVLALISNAFAGRERALSLTQTYAAPTRDGQPPRDAMILENPSTGPDETVATGGAATTPPATAAGTSPAATSAAAIPQSARELATPDILERFPPTEDLPSVDITSDDAAFLHSRGALFMDARRTSEYLKGHIKGARSFPVWEADIDQRVKTFADASFDTNAPIVVYCSGGDCQDSHLLAQKLWGMFFNNVLIYTGGYPDWQKRTGAVSTGGTP